MIMIDPKGLFGGERLRACSNNARLLWPYIYCLRNTLGRMEIDPDKISAEAFWSFNPRPTGDEISSALLEYSSNYLLFVYESGGSVWGFWDSPEGVLPTYQTKKDLHTPAPDGKDLQAWRVAYLSGKKATSELSRKFQKFPHSVVIGIGVGVVNLSSPKNGEASANPTHATPAGSESGTPPSEELAEPAQPTAADPDCSTTLNSETVGDTGVTDAVRRVWFEDLAWPLTWRKSDKATARKFFVRLARTEEDRDLIVAGMQRDRPAMLAREPEHRPYLSTWLNKKRYEDDNEPDPAAVPNGMALGKSKIDEVFDRI